MNTLPPKRKAVVQCGDRRKVEAYLPAGYWVTTCADGKTYIEGTDRAGWTLEGYVIPRLASGLMHCEEIRNEKK